MIHLECMPPVQEILDISITVSILVIWRPTSTDKLNYCCMFSIILFFGCVNNLTKTLYKRINGIYTVYTTVLTNVKMNEAIVISYKIGTKLHTSMTFLHFDHIKAGFFLLLR